VVDIAVGIIIGAAFTAIVNSSLVAGSDQPDHRHRSPAASISPICSSTSPAAISRT
jgi:hypothetical protein